MRGYVPAIDGLRGVAIGLVLLYHAPWIFGLHALADGSWVWRASYGCWIGVDLFFVVSGYLITTILLDRRGTPSYLGTFWIRRALRILPLSFLYLAVLGANAASGNPTGALEAFPGWGYYLGYVGNLYIAATGWKPLPLMILWSLAIEEQFYLVWPLFTRGASLATLRWLCAAMVVVAPAVRLAEAATRGYPAAYVDTLGRIDALAVGCALALWTAEPAGRAAATRYCALLLPLAVTLLIASVALRFGPSDAPFNWHPPAVTALGFSALALAWG